MRGRPHDAAVKSRSITPTLARTIAATSLGLVVVQLDVTIVNVALPRISTDLGANAAALQWVVDTYALVFAALLLSAGALGDRSGSRRVYIAGFVVFALGSAACGFAPNSGILIAARAVQGIGAALLVPTSLALLNHASAHESALRARAVGLWTAAGGVAIATGPVIGGLLLRILGWRSIFLVNLPIAVAGVVLTLRSVPKVDKSQKQHSLDVAGQLLAILALTGLIGAVIEFRPLGATNPVVIAGITLALLGGVAFIAVEARTRAPILPLHFFRLPSFSASVVFGTLLNFTYYGVIFVLSLYLQQARGYSALETGLAYLPLTGTLIISNVASGWMSARMGSRVPMAMGALIGAVGFGLLHRLGATSPYLAMLPTFILISSGIGLAVPAMTTALLSSVEPAWSGTVSAVLNAARQAGGAIGVAVFGALASGARDEIIAGLKVSALTSVALLAIAAALAWLGVRPARSIDKNIGSPHFSGET